MRQLVTPTFTALLLSLAAPALCEETEKREEIPDTPPIPEEPTVKPEPPAVPTAFRYRVNARPALWMPISWWSQTRFRLAPGTAEVSLEDDLKADVPFLLLPLEFYIRTETKEFRIRYVWWNMEGSHSFSGQFGDVTFTSERARGTLSTHVLSADYLQRIVEYPLFELYLTAGMELLVSNFELSGTSGSAELEAVAPIMTVGLGVRFPLRENWSVFFSSSALSYADLFGIPDTFFPVKGIYRNVDLSVRQDRTPRFCWGVGWKHYEAGPENSELKAYQRLTGPSVWLSYRF